MNLIGPIESAEQKYKQILEDYFISVYDEKSASSHGIEHHRRVWHYAKELITLLPFKETDFNSQIPSKLLIASYLHDIGMSVETGERHGRHSKDMCIDFLSKNHLPEDSYADVLEAIENHDNKEYQGNNAENEIRTILSVADDMDAFGFTGIYRYSEIYLIRGINLSEIGNLIKVNAVKRFDHLTGTFSFSDNLIQKQKRRYDILNDFFGEYNKEVRSYHFGGGQPSGYCGVMELFIEMINDGKDLKELYSEADKYQSDKVIQWFFDGLRSELNFLQISDK